VQVVDERTDQWISFCHAPELWRSWSLPEIIFIAGQHAAFAFRHKKVSRNRMIIVDTIFLAEKINASFRDILTTLFKYLNHRRFSGGNFRVRFFLT
jgi:hypothetical protein